MKGLGIVWDFFVFLSMFFCFPVWGGFPFIFLVFPLVFLVFSLVVFLDHAQPPGIRPQKCTVTWKPLKDLNEMAGKAPVFWFWILFQPFFR